MLCAREKNRTQKNHNGEKMKKVLIPFSESYPRCGEGSGVLLSDGKVLLVYSLFTGTSDHDRSELVSAVFDCETGTLADEKIIHKQGNYLNQMSVSLERLKDGSIALLWLRKLSAKHDEILFSRSFDEGKTWSAPVKVLPGDTYPDYVVVNNDRLRQLRSGRLIIPVCVYPGGFGDDPSRLELWYSDDMGAKWKRSAEIQPYSAPVEPAPYACEAPFDQVCAGKYKEQEPGVEECADGSVYYYCRTILGYMYDARSYSQGKDFTELSAQTDIVSPLAPQSIRREPGSERLWCVYNDQSAIAYGDVANHWGWRTPLMLAYSDDNGRHWQKFRKIEDESHNYCYTSITFVESKKVLLTYYESENRADGTRRNLASFKAQVFDLP